MIRDRVTLETAHARGTVYATAGLFTDIEFRLPSGRWVSPLATAPWGEVSDPAIPGHLRRLGGEFFCLPFGGGGTVRDPIPGWEGLMTAPADEQMHGPAANADWQIIEHDRQSVRLGLDLPDEFPVSRIERHISLGVDRPCSRSAVTLEIRRGAFKVPTVQGYQRGADGKSPGGSSGMNARLRFVFLGLIALSAAIGAPHAGSPARSR